MAWQYFIFKKRPNSKNFRQKSTFWGFLAGFKVSACPLKRFNRLLIRSHVGKTIQCTAKTGTGGVKLKE
jgi:hypothetical protein